MNEGSANASLHKMFEDAIPVLTNYCRKLTSRNPDSTMADDLVQEALTRGWERVNQYRKEYALSSWLIRIAINIHNDMHRYNKRRRYTDHISFEVAPESERRITTTPVQDAEILVIELNSTINGLPPIYRESLCLLLASDTYHESAEKLNIPLSTHKTRVHRAKQLLAKSMRRPRR
jgi:RNA polymerase sigma factor (sigma-70 family)